MDQFSTNFATINIFDMYPCLTALYPTFVSVEEWQNFVRPHVDELAYYTQCIEYTDWSMIKQPPARFLVNQANILLHRRYSTMSDEVGQIIRRFEFGQMLWDEDAMRLAMFTVKCSEMLKDCSRLVKRMKNMLLCPY